MSRPRSRPGTRRRGWAVLALAGLALAAVVGIRPPHAPPLYDGLGFPDEPYRWVVAPVGAAATPPVTDASVALTVDATGTSAAGRALSAENGPQVALAVAAGAFSAPPGTATITLSATPAAAPPPPGDGTVVSNLYRIAATARSGAVTLRPAQNVVLNLRSDVATDQVVLVERWSGTGWEQVSTRQVGTDIYAAQLDRLGAVALVRLARGATPTVSGPATGSTGAGATATGAADPTSLTGSSGPGSGLWVALAAFGLLLVAALVALRARTARQPAAATEDAVGSTGPGEDGRA